MIVLALLMAEKIIFEPFVGSAKADLVCASLKLQFLARLSSRFTPPSRTSQGRRSARYDSRIQNAKMHWPTSSWLVRA
jgi:hypothetical protein